MIWLSSCKRSNRKCVCVCVCLRHKSVSIKEHHILSHEMLKLLENWEGRVISGDFVKVKRDGGGVLFVINKKYSQTLNKQKSLLKKKSFSGYGGTSLFSSASISSCIIINEINVLSSTHLQEKQKKAPPPTLPPILIRNLERMSQRKSMGKALTQVHSLTDLRYPQQYLD